MKTLTIGQLAKKTTVNRETIRYYERIYLLPEPYRAISGYRQYSNNDVARLQFIKNAKQLGLTLKEISEMLLLRTRENSTCGDIKDRIDNKISNIEEKIQSLQAIKKALIKLKYRCQKKNAPSRECPILKFLDTRP